MLPLDSSRWAALEHAYGSAADVPALLRAIAANPEPRAHEGPWFELWSCLAHQGDVYPASFAAVPHVVAALAADPLRCRADHLHFPAWVEVCRRAKAVVIPSDLEPAYTAALARLPALVAAAAAREWDEGFTRCAVAAIAAAKGHADLADLVLDVDADALDDFRAWREDR